MQAYLLRVIIALASVGLAPLATYLIDRGGVDVEQFRGIAQAARPIALLMLTVFLVAFAAKRPAGMHEPENTLDAPNFCSVWHHAAIVLYVVYGSPRSCDLPSARGARAPGARLLCASPMVRRRLLSADGCHRFSYQQNRRVWPGAMVTLLFNPVAEIQLSRSTWVEICCTSTESVIASPEIEDIQHERNASGDSFVTDWPAHVMSIPMR
jgi:hypothetical protein